MRLQNPFGTCWGFGATAAAESSILADPELNEGLKKGKPVQVRIRGYVEVWDELHYGQWSKTRSSGK